MAKKTARNYATVTTLRQMTLVNQQKRAGKALFRFQSAPGVISEVTYGDFYYKCEKLISALRQRNMVGKRIALIGETCPEWVECFMAGISAGCVVIPLDKELIFNELRGFMQISKADVIFMSPKYAAKYAELAELGVFDTLEYIITPDTSSMPERPSDDRFFTLDEFIRGYAPEEILPSEIMRAKPRGDMSIMLFTSGTTGTSKCVMLSERNLMSCATSCCQAVNFYENDVTLSILPMHHTYELAITVGEMLYGMTVCINDSLKHITKNLKLFKPTALILVPLIVSTFNKRIWDEARKAGRERQLKLAMTASQTLRKFGVDMRDRFFGDITAFFGGNLREIICGGAAMEDGLMKTFDAIGIELCEGYGITECSPLIAVNPYYKRKVGSVGPAVSCCEVRIDAESIDEAGHTIGEIVVKGENVMIGYYDNDEANAAVFTDDGAFRTGDLGYMDEDGYLFITGRKKTVIVLGNGKNVFPEELEEYLDRIPSVAECVVVGRKKPDQQDIALTAVIYPNFNAYEEGETTENIAADIKKSVMELNRTLPSFKQIRNIELRTTEFEKTSSRKIKRYLVK